MKLDRVLLTVIIPAYNAERTIVRTVQSVLNQTFRDLEVFIVDDGSTDATSELVDRLMKEDARVFVLHQSNQRAYAARVNALKFVRTPYVAFVDADDVLELNMYEKLYSFATKYDLDVAQCGIFGESFGSDAPDLYLTKEDVRRNFVVPYLIEGRRACFVWDKLYKSGLVSSVVEKLDILMFDDMALNLQLFENVRRVGILHEGLYHYDINLGSSVCNFKKRSIDDLRAVIALRAKWAFCYGVGADDLRLHRWIVKNVRNCLISACVARMNSFGECMTNVKILLASPELELALSKLGSDHSSCVKFVRSFSRIPLPIAIGLIKGSKFAQRIMRTLKNYAISK